MSTQDGICILEGYILNYTHPPRFESKRKIALNSLNRWTADYILHAIESHPNRNPIDICEEIVDKFDEWSCSDCIQSRTWSICCDCAIDILSHLYANEHSGFFGCF